jgi:hypothetical protein
VQTLSVQYKKVLIIIFVALIPSIALTLILQHLESTQIESFTLNTTISVSNETTFSHPYEGFVKKGYFDSVAIVYVYLFSPYASGWDTFNAWMSLDNSSWTSVPFLNSTTENYNKMANLGPINLGDPKLTIYQKYHVPPQDIRHPPNVTIQDLTNLKADVTIRMQATPSDRIQWILVFFAVFGVIGWIVTLFKERLESKSSKYSKKKKKKTSRKPKKREKIKFLELSDSTLSFHSSET